jgi:CheY-like chemotaxis protein
MVLGDDGVPTRSLGVAVDISDRKRAEDEHSRLEEQPRQAQKLQAIGRLAGSVAHDFNNLLLAIRGYAELAQNGLQRGGDVSHELQELVLVADRAADLTGQLLAFSRKQMMRPERLDLDTVVGEMQKLLQLLVGEQVELDLAPAARAVPLDADGPRRPCAVLTVSDTGCGMDAETSAQIFEPFFTTKQEGTGLGLATVHGIVTQTGGSIWVNSGIGQGTMFKIYLPLSAQAQPVAPAPARALPAGASNGETILLVEVRGLVAAMLEDRGYRVLAAADADTALRIADPAYESVDLILSDLAVAGANGCEIADSARKLHPDAVVLQMSGYTDEAMVRRGVLERGAAFIEKPFSSDELARHVQDALSTRSAA